MPSETTVKGEIACLKLEQRAIEKNIIVSRPSIECEYDRVVDKDGKLSRVQVKYAGSTKRKGSVQANIGKASKKKHGSHEPYNEEEIDAIVVYIPQADMLCWFEKEVWSGKTKLQIRYEPAKNGQTKGCRMAQDYVW